MAAPHVHPPNLDRPLSLAAFSCEVWLHRLLAADRNRLPEAGYGAATWDAMLARITNDAETLRGLRRGLDALRDAAKKNQRLAAPDTELVRLFIRVLDDHLVRTRPERVAHLLSFYSSLDVSTAADHDWVDPSAFFSAWAAGESRSKYEVLDRGQQAAAMILQLRDHLDERLAGQARPASPYHQPRTLAMLLRQTSAELVGVMSLPVSSGGAAAARHLTTIGAVALEEMSRHLFGDETPRDRDDTSPAFGSVASWRLPRVLTRIGEISRDPDVQDRVWGPRRGREVVQQARRMLTRLLEEETPNINRARSLLVEAYRYLDNGDVNLQEIVLARLELARTAKTTKSGAAVAIQPFGDNGVLSTREQAYTALVLCEKNSDLVGRVCAMLRKELPRAADFDGFQTPVAAARAYAAAYIDYRHRLSKSPPLDAFLSAQVLDADRQAFERKGASTWGRVDDVWDWFDSADGNVDSVRRPAVAVWQALRSAADECIEGGTLVGPYWQSREQYDQRVRRFFKQRGPAAVRADDVLRPLPFHAREATRALVAQAVLSVDGTARREAVESLRQAGLADEAAKLFELVVQHCRSVRDSDGPGKQGHPLDWLREQAVFCLSYTGSLAGFDTLVREAGLATDVEETGWGELPREQPGSERWIRTTALLGLSDLGDVLHDDDDEQGKKRIDLLLTRITERLKQIAKMQPATKWGAEGSLRREGQLRYLEDGEERRALVAVVAMLRSEVPASVKLLHVLSGRYVVAEEGRQNKKRWWNGSAPPPLIEGPFDALSGTVVYGTKSVDSESWDAYMGEMGPVADTWDLACWQLAEWGLSRIERRFRPTEESGGVRITDPLEASKQAEKRMRDHREGRFAPGLHPRPGRTAAGTGASTAVA